MPWQVNGCETGPTDTGFQNLRPSHVSKQKDQILVLRAGKLTSGTPGIGVRSKFTPSY